MATARVVTITLFALPLVTQLSTFDGSAAVAQPRFAQPRAETSDIRFRRMDRNNDGVITREEWRGSDQSFATHDWNRDGILSGDEVRRGARRSDARSENVFDTAGANMDLDREDRFEDLDMNRNGVVERGEWHGSDDAFEWLDRDNDGRLSRAEAVGPQASSGAGAVGTSGRQDCNSNAAEVVDDIYQQVLERSADTSSAELTQGLVAGRLTVRDIVSRLAKSPEHADRFFWRPIASAVYRRIMRRDASPSELRDIAADLASGQSHLPLVIARIAGRAESNPEDAVRLVYRGLLGRDADPAGLRGHTDLARRDGIEAVARAIAESPEFQQSAGPAGLPRQEIATYESAVRSLYRHVLGRDADPRGLRDLTEVAAGSGFEGVIDRLLASSEYERLYGAHTVPGRNVRYCGSTR